KGRAKAMLAIIAAAARHKVAVSPSNPETAPHRAEPMANEPSAHNVCSEAARARTQGGALVCVAALKVDIIAIHAAPPSTRATYTSACQADSAAMNIAPAKMTQQPAASASRPSCVRRRAMKK